MTSCGCVSDMLLLPGGPEGSQFGLTCSHVTEAPVNASIMPGWCWLGYLICVHRAGPQGTVSQAALVRSPERANGGRPAATRPDRPSGTGLDGLPAPA